MSQQDVLPNEGKLPLTEEHVLEASSNLAGKQDIEHIQEQFVGHIPRSPSPVLTTLGSSSEESGKATANDVESDSIPQTESVTTSSNNLEDAISTGIIIPDLVVSSADITQREAEMETSQQCIEPELPAENTDVPKDPDDVVHSVTEEAVRLLEPENEGALGVQEEVTLLNERLSLGVGSSVEPVIPPLKHSASTVPIAPTSPRQEMEESQVDLGTSESKVSNADTSADHSDEVTQPATHTLESASTLSDPEPISTQGSIPIPIPSTAQSEVEMLNSRLERGLNTPVDMSLSPSIINRSISNQPIPPTTPRPDDVSEPLSPVEQQSTVFEGNTDQIKVDNPSRTESPPATAEHIQSESGEMEGSTTPDAHPSANSQPSDEHTTPVAVAIQIIEPEPQTGTEEKGPLIIDLRSGSPVLELPAEGEGAKALDARFPLDRSTSMVPEPPTSPQSEPESYKTEVHTPTTGIPPPEPLSALSAKMSLAPENHRLDFVDDARSERSVATSVAPIAPNSPRFITPLPTPSLADVDGFSFYDTGRGPNLSIAPGSRPLTEGMVKKLPEANDIVQELAPELTDALNTSFQDGAVFPPNTVRPSKALQPNIITGPLPTVNEDGTLVSPSQNTTSRPRPAGHASSPSTWSIQRASGWFNSPPDTTQGRASMDVAEGEFSRPTSRAPRGEYPPAATSPSKSDDGRCIVM